MTLDPITKLTRQLDARPDEPVLLLNLSAHLRRAGRIAESSALLIRCCRIYADDDQTDRARACLTQLLRFDPDNPQALRLLKRL